MAIWAQHTVAGGAGSEIDWYEINASRTASSPAPSLFQSGTVSSPSLWVFNGAISSDRIVTGPITAYGSSMVLGFNTSSAQSYPAIQMVSKIGDKPQAPFVFVRQSSGPLPDSDCGSDACRWGDYSGAAPDPGAVLGLASGKVWLGNQYVTPTFNNLNVKTWVWQAKP